MKVRLIGRFGDKVDPNQYNENMEMDTEPIIDSIMEPGDAVQIPAHYPHLATSTTSRLSVSFPMPEPTAKLGWNISRKRMGKL